MRSAEDLDEERRGIVTTGLLDGTLDQELGGVPRFVRGLGISQDAEDLGIKEAIDDAIAAEQKPVAGLVTDGTDLGFGELMPGTEGFLQRVATRMIAGFAFVDFTLPVQPADVGVVLA